LFRIFKGGFLEVSNIDEFKSMLSKTEDNDTFFAEAMFTYQ